MKWRVAALRGTSGARWGRREVGPSGTWGAAGSTPRLHFDDLPRAMLAVVVALLGVGAYFAFRKTQKTREFDRRNATSPPQTALFSPTPLLFFQFMW